jgi:hypothetical protein
VQALKDQLKWLPAGEWVIAPSVQRLPGLSLPPDPLLAEIRAYCLERGLQFSDDESGNHQIFVLR